MCVCVFVWVCSLYDNSSAMLWHIRYTICNAYTNLLEGKKKMKNEKQKWKVCTMNMRYEPIHYVLRRYYLWIFILLLHRILPRMFIIAVMITRLHMRCDGRTQHTWFVSLIIMKVIIIIRAILSLLSFATIQFYLRII